MPITAFVAEQRGMCGACCRDYNVAERVVPPSQYDESTDPHPRHLRCAGRGPFNERTGEDDLPWEPFGEMGFSETAYLLPVIRAAEPTVPWTPRSSLSPTPGHITPTPGKNGELRAFIAKVGSALWNISYELLGRGALLTKTDIEGLAKLHSVGMTADEVARALMTAISRRDVARPWNYACSLLWKDAPKRSSVPISHARKAMRPPRWSSAEEEQLYELVDAGDRTLNDIAQTLGRSTSAISARVALRYGPQSDEAGRLWDGINRP